MKRKSDIALPFPIKTATSCQLKWSHSTVYLTENKTASCHRVLQNTIPEDFDFHNTPEKIQARKLMLEGKWPGKGCEHCKLIEDAGGTSDRLLHKRFPGLGPPPEVEAGDLTATHVTPRWLEIYFSNLCNLSCIYCNEHYSSTWEKENLKFGDIFTGERIKKQYNNQENVKKIFDWLDKNGEHLYNLIILGGEPFTQPQTDQLLDFLTTKTYPDLTLTLFSNLSIKNDWVVKKFQKMQSLKDNGNIKEIHVIGSIDCWGKHAEYVRHGLNLDLFEQNFEYMLHNTSLRLGINSTWTTLTTKTFPDLVDKINQWNSHRVTYFTLMQAAGMQRIHPSIFGPWILDQGFNQAIENFQTYGDPELSSYKEYFQGIKKSIEQSCEDRAAQFKLHEYLSELDRRRNRNYVELWPEIHERIHRKD